MIIGKVTGTVTATVKAPELSGATLLVVSAQDELPPIVAVDTVGAGAGDQVLIATGSAARLPAQTSGAPVDAAVIAIVDQVDMAKP